MAVPTNNVYSTSTGHEPCKRTSAGAAAKAQEGRRKLAAKTFVTFDCNASDAIVAMEAEHHQDRLLYAEMKSNFAAYTMSSSWNKAL